MGELQGVRGTKANTRHLPPSVESSQAFVDRTLRWWDTVIVPLSQAEIIPIRTANEDNEDEVEEEPILVLAVTHGAYIATLVHAGLIGEREFRGRSVARGPVYNTSISVIQLDDGGSTGEVLGFAHIEHLISPATTQNADELGRENR